MLKSKWQAIVLAVFVAVVAGSALSAVASAATPEFLIAGAAVKANTNILVQSQTGLDAVLLGTLVGTAVEILCEVVDTEKGTQLVSNGAESKTANLVIVFLTCVFAKGGAGCTVENVKLESTVGTLLTTTTMSFAPKTGTLFATIVVSKCILEGNQKVELDAGGKVECKLPGATTKAVLHEIECLEAGDTSLLFAGAASSFEVKGVDVQLESGAEWATS